MSENDKPVVQVDWRSPERAEANELAREMAANRDRYHRWYALAYETTPKDSALIDDEWRRCHEKQIVEGAEDKPADQVQWYDIDQLSDFDPERAQALWTRVRQEAREEAESGWRAARVMECDGTKHGPWDRARFLALREALREEWRPRVGTESTLVDMLAQIQAAYELWLGRHIHRMTYTGVEVTREEKEYRAGRGQYVTQRVGEYEETEQTARMVDRWQRAYLRTVRALRDLRRHSAVVINNPGQVNIGEQQVNLNPGV